MPACAGRWTASNILTAIATLHRQTAATTAWTTTTASVIAIARRITPTPRASTLTAFISTDDVITILPHADIIGTMGNATIEGSISTVQEIVDVEMECIVVRIVTAIIIIFNGYQ